MVHHTLGYWKSRRRKARIDDHTHRRPACKKGPRTSDSWDMPPLDYHHHHHYLYFYSNDQRRERLSLPERCSFELRASI